MIPKPKVKHLREILDDVDPERNVYLSIDPEGNMYRPFGYEILSRKIHGVDSLVIFPSDDFFCPLDEYDDDDEPGIISDYTPDNT